MSSSKVKCTCGWEWNKSDSSKKDMYICHECGRDNSNNMKNGGWLDSYADGGTMQEHQENYNNSSVSMGPGFVGEGTFNGPQWESPAWGGQFQEGGEIINAQGGKKVKPIYVESKNDPRYKAYNDSLSLYNKGQISLQDFNTLVNKYDIKKTWSRDDAYIPDQKIQPIQQKGITYIYDVNKNNGFGQYLSNKGLKPVTDALINKRAMIYKNPQQQVIVKDNNSPQYKTIHTGEGEGRFELIERPKIKAIQNNIQPKGIENNFSIDAQLPVIRPNARIPKYYDVEDYTHGSTNYIGNQTNYRTSDLSTLSEQSPNNTRKITPHYQMGGNVYPVNYVPQAQTGASMPGTPGFTYARTNDPAPSEGPYAKKTLPSAQNGVDMYGAPITANIKYDPSLKRTNYNPRINQINFGYDMPYIQSQEEKDKTLAHENRHAWQFANNRTNFDIVHNPEYAFQERLKKKPEVSSTDEVFNSYHNRKQKEVELDVKSFKQNNPDLAFMPDEMVYKKFVDSMQYANPNSVEGEAEYYQNTGRQFQNGGEMKYYQNGLDWKPKGMKDGGWLDGYKEGGGIIKDDRGQWDHPGEITEISGDTMATHGYGDIPLYVVPDKGKPRMVQPDTGIQKFPGAKKFIEYPMAKNGIRQEQKGLVNLDNLVNFTNYNKQQSGGWLDSL